MLAYDSGHLFDSSEFMEDANRIVLAAKLLDKWVNYKETNPRLLINHIVIIENSFGETGLYALYEYVSEFPAIIEPMMSALFYMKKISRPALYDVEFLDLLYSMDA